MKRKTKLESYEVDLVEAVKVYQVRCKGISIRMKLSQNHIEIGNEFVFKSSNSKETVDRWEKVLGAISICLRVAKDALSVEESKVKNNVKKRPVGRPKKKLGGE